MQIILKSVLVPFTQNIKISPCLTKLQLAEIGSL